MILCVLLSVAGQLFPDYVSFPALKFDPKVVRDVSILNYFITLNHKNESLKSK